MTSVRVALDCFLALPTVVIRSPRASLGFPAGPGFVTGCTPAAWASAAPCTRWATDLPSTVTPMATSTASSTAARAETTMVAVRQRAASKVGTYDDSTDRVRSPDRVHILPRSVRDVRGNRRQRQDDAGGAARRRAARRWSKRRRDARAGRDGARRTRPRVAPRARGRDRAV